MTIAAGTERIMRPLRHLPWRSTAAGNIGLVAPGAAVAVAIAIGEGRPARAVAAIVVVLLVAAVVIVPALRIGTRLDADGITSFWIGGHRVEHIPRERVTRGVVRTIYTSDGISTHRHLFLLDAAERTVFRMTSRWWTDEQLLTVAHHLAVPLDSQAQPIHLAEIRRTSPSHLRWSERHSVLAMTLTVGVGFLLCFAFVVLTSV